jgi:uncharacterized protein (TIGR03435 family)
MKTLWLLILLLIAQNPQLPGFEVATLKPSAAGTGINFSVPQARYIGCHGTDNLPQTGVPAGVTIPLGRCIAKNTVRSVIGYAYGIPESQTDRIISGGPQWLDDPYEIEAKAENPATTKELKLMMQALLLERIKLAFHRETRDVAVFDLVVAKGGVRIQPVSKDKECVSSTTLGPCHNFFGGRGRGLHAQSVSMADLAAELTDWADRIVLDRTGLSGLYNIETTPWTPDNPSANFGAEAGTDPRNLPTLFSMLPEQLGLRLEAQKEPIQILIIDKAEKPGPGQN